MKRSILGCAFLLCSMSTAWAAPMPHLPALPPLPETYVEVGSWDGTYAGLVGGLVANGAVAGTIGVVAGTALVNETVILGIEGMALFHHGSSSLEAIFRLGLPVVENVAVFSQLSLGVHSDDGMFAGIGASLEYQQNETLTWRAQYRHALDLSGEPGKGAFLVGAIFNF